MLLAATYGRDDSVAAKPPANTSALDVPLRSHHHQRVHSAAARFRLPEYAKSKEQLDLLQIGIDPSEDKERQLQQQQLTSLSNSTLSATAEDELSATTSSPSALIARRIGEVLANKHVREVRRVLHERSQQQQQRASTAGGGRSAAAVVAGATSVHDVSNPADHHHNHHRRLPMEQHPQERPVTVGDIQRRRQELWAPRQGSMNLIGRRPASQPAPLPTTTTNADVLTTDQRRLPPRGCTPTAADPLRLLEESVNSAAATNMSIECSYLEQDDEQDARQDSHGSDHKQQYRDDQHRREELLPPRPSTSAARLSSLPPRGPSSRLTGRLSPSAAEDDGMSIRHVRRPQSVGGTWDHAMPSNYEPLHSSGTDTFVAGLYNTRGLACSDIADIADDVFDLAGTTRAGECDEEDESGSSSSSNDGAQLYTHDNLVQMRLEITRYELSEELAQLVARRTQLQHAKDAKLAQRIAIRQAAQEEIQSYSENHAIVAGEMNAMWAAHRKRLDDERAAVRLRQLPVVNGVVRKKFIFPKHPSPWSLMDIDTPATSPPRPLNEVSKVGHHQATPMPDASLEDENDDYDSLVATAVVSPKTSRPGSSSSALGQALQRVAANHNGDSMPTWRRDMELSKQTQGPMRSQSATTIAKRKRAIDRKRLATMPEAQRYEVFLMRAAEFNRYVTNVEPSARCAIVDSSEHEWQAMVAVLEKGLMAESRDRRAALNTEQIEWRSLVATAAGELRTLQTREWAPTVFADRKRQEFRAAAEIASPSQRQAVLEAATEAHRRDIRAVWDKMFDLRAQLLATQRQALAKKNEIRLARNACGEASRIAGDTLPVPGVSITRADAASTTAAQRLQILELQLGMLEEKQVELRKSIEALQSTTW